MNDLARLAAGGAVVAGQEVALGRAHRHQTVTVFVSEITLGIDLDDGEPLSYARDHHRAVRSIKGQRPRNAASGS